jgi:hypothetical protein
LKKQRGKSLAADGGRRKLVKGTNDRWLPRDADLLLNILLSRSLCKGKGNRRVGACQGKKQKGEEYRRDCELDRPGKMFEEGGFDSASVI